MLIFFVLTLKMILQLPLLNKSCPSFIVRIRP